MKIVFDPLQVNNNEYASIIVEELQKNNHQIYTLKQMFSSIKIFRSIKLVHLNWYENVENEIDFIKKTLKVLIFVLTNKKIVWTMHNKISHDKNKSLLEKTLMFLIVKNASIIITHSKISRDVLTDKFPFLKKRNGMVQYVPHPDYIDIYGKMATSSNKESSRLKLLFIGAVKPYKNIELLIRIAKEFPEAELLITIAGATYSEEYRNRLIEMASGTTNLNLVLKFIPNSHIPKYFAEVDLMILPYDTVSSLNSGTVILAFSYGKSVICPEIGTTLDVIQKNKLMLYKYVDPEDHFLVLREKVREAISMKKKDINVFNVWGDEMKSEIQKCNDKGKVGTILSDIYNECNQKN